MKKTKPQKFSKKLYDSAFKQYSEKKKSYGTENANHDTCSETVGANSENRDHIHKLLRVMSSIPKENDFSKCLRKQLTIKLLIHVYEYCDD